MDVQSNNSNAPTENKTVFTAVAEGAKIPVRGTPGAAGYDLFALEARTIIGGEGSVLVPTGIAVKIPRGHYARIAPRSGLALKQHIAVNAGVVDRDYYPNPLGVILYCTRNGHSYTVQPGERFAQLIIEAIDPSDDSNDNNDVSVNTHAGFGSTGKN
jgi:dUTP pyrophosphatase